MKRVIIFAVLFCAFSINTISAQYGVDNIFRKYKNDSGVISMKFEGDISSFFNRNDGEGLKSKIEAIEFIVFNEDKDISEKDRTKLREKVDGDNYEMLIQAREKGQKIEIMGIDTGDFIKKVFAQVKSNEFNAYFFLTGEIYFEDLSELNISKLMDGIDLD